MSSPFPHVRPWLKFTLTSHVFEWKEHKMVPVPFTPSIPHRNPNLPCEPELTPPGVFDEKPTLPPPLPPSLWGLSKGQNAWRSPPLPSGGMASGFVAPQHMVTSCAYFLYRMPPPPQLPLLPPSAPPVGHAMLPRPLSPGSRLNKFHCGVGSKAMKEFLLPCEVKMTVFVGKFLPSLEDGFLTSILKLCGPIRSWTRGSDPVNGSLKGFGFCEYESPEGLLRALRLLQRLKLEGQELVLKVDNATLKHLRYYVDRKLQWLRHEKKEVGHVPGLEATDEDIPEEVPIEERLGWVCDMEKKIDKEVSMNLLSLIQQKERTKSDGLTSCNIGDLGFGLGGENAQEGAAGANLERSKVVEWRQFDYELEKFKLRGIREKCRSSDSYYVELENLWEKREKAKEEHRRLESERDQERREVRRRQILEEEKNSERHKLRSCKDKYAKTGVEREEDERSCVHERTSFSSTSKEGDVSSDMLLDLSTRAKVAFQFKCSMKLRAASMDGTGDGGGKPLIGKGHGEPLPTSMEDGSGWGTVHRSSYRSFTWEPGSTRPKESFVPVEMTDMVRRTIEVDLDKGSEDIASRRNKTLDLKEVIDMIPRTKDALFSCSMDWDTFDKHCLHERIRPWISKKITELLGEEEVTLVDFIVTSAKKHMTPSHLLELLENIFVEEAELFMVKLWRMVIYETKKVELGLSGSC